MIELKAHYILRFDDICPTMNWRVWSEIELLLIKKHIRPILTVVPENRDPKLMVDAPAADFWERVRCWQARGWTIALHGYQHRYVNREPGLLRISWQSEFACLTRAEQEEKLRRGLAIFATEGVRAEAWAAPSHSFDWTTVELISELGIRFISDGFAFVPYQGRFDTIWVPQQFSQFRAMPWGIWTFCYHINNMRSDKISTLLADLERYSTSFVTLPEAVNMGVRERRTLADFCLAGLRMGLSAGRRARQTALGKG